MEAAVEGVEVSKGSKRRPRQVPRDLYEHRWQRTFNALRCECGGVLDRKPDLDAYKCWECGEGYDGMSEEIRSQRREGRR